MPKIMVKDHKSINNEGTAKAISNQMQYQKRGKNSVKSLKQTDTVEVVSSNLTVPTMTN
jgi:hypothetical protein